ncbi:signal peptidase I [Kineococcus gypseus]|uniref:signal peptidase I n=1 Tax=Kineococcus gypseus TaxID=1637102 RepID=UPI003D7EC99E
MAHVLPGPRRSGSTLLLAVALLVLAACLLAGRAGYQLVTLETGSMAPAHPAGSLLLEREQPLEDLRAGQVITFRAPTPRGQTLTHRVTDVQRTADGSVVVRTRGDANAGEDPWDAVVGDDRVWRVVGGVPHAGAVLSAARGVAGTPTALVLGALVALAVVWLPAGRRTDRRGERPGPGPCWSGRRRRSAGRVRPLARRATAASAVAALAVTASATAAEAAWDTSVARGHAVRSARLVTPSIVSVRDGCLFAGGTNRDQVVVTFTAAADDRRAVRVERRTVNGSGGGSWAVVGTLAPGATTFADPTVAFLTRYGYRLTHTAGPWSGTTSGEVQILTVPNCL